MIKNICKRKRSIENKAPVYTQIISTVIENKKNNSDDIVKVKKVVNKKIQNNKNSNENV
jgi:hypothetical protein